jgi:hypothetical protein
MSPIGTSLLRGREEERASLGGLLADGRGAIAEYVPPSAAWLASTPQKNAGISAVPPA